MTDGISSRMFHEETGVEDWRCVYGHATACFRTGDFATGVEFVAAIGALADQRNHHPDVTLRYPDVTVRLISHDIGRLSHRDVDLARAISEIARERGITADPANVQRVNLTIDALDRTAIMPFWRAVLGYVDEGDEDLVDPRGLTPPIWFQQLDEPRAERNTIHVDVAVPHELAEARVAAALAAGGRLVTDAHAPSWWVLADAEGNEACIATWIGRWWEEPDAG